MQYSTIPFEVKLPEQAFSFDVHALHRVLLPLVDQRGRKGRIYALATILTIAVLAKLSGQNQIRAVAHWSKLRQRELTHLFGLPYLTMPHHTTWSRILGSGVDIAQLEQVLGHFFKQHLPSTIAKRGSVVLAIDGKALKGTIAAGETRGVHLMAAYLPQYDIVLAQVAVDGKENEIVAAPRLLAQLDLRGMVVVGDAMQCQRVLSVQVVTDGGDYVWFVKDNQPSLLTDLKILFEPEPLAVGHSPTPTDFKTARTVEKAPTNGYPGRIERREITVSSMLAGYSNWPYLAQAFKLEYWSEPLPLSPEQAVKRAAKAKKPTKAKTKTKTKTSKCQCQCSSAPQEGERQVQQVHEVRYGITSLGAEVAGPARLLEIARAEWGIENNTHEWVPDWRRDVTLGEDASQLRRGNAPQANAILNNTVLGLLGLAGISNVAAARRELEYVVATQLAHLTC